MKYLNPSSICALCFSLDEYAIRRKWNNLSLQKGMVYEFESRPVQKFSSRLRSSSNISVSVRRDLFRNDDYQRLYYHYAQRNSKNGDKTTMVWTEVHKFCSTAMGDRRLEAATHRRLRIILTRMCKYVVYLVKYLISHHCFLTLWIDFGTRFKAHFVGLVPFDSVTELYCVHFELDGFETKLGIFKFKAI